MQSAGLGASFPAAKRRPARFAEACRPSTLGNILEERQGARRKALGKTDLEATLSSLPFGEIQKQNYKLQISPFHGCFSTLLATDSLGNLYNTAKT